jgi:hypothetical protein
MRIIMRNLFMRSKLVGGVAISVFAAPVFAVDPYLPAPGSNALVFSISNQKASELKAGTTQAQLPVDLKQDTYKLNYSYGISDPLALDIEVGYAKSKFATVPGLAPNGGLKGITDSRVGLRFRVLDDHADAPVTLTLGAAAILKGSYDTGALPAIGDGANAVEISASVGKAFTSKFNGFIAAGYRDRQGPVPNETFYKFGLNFSPSAALGLSLSHEAVKSKGSLDIGGPGFAPNRFPEVREEYSFTALSASFRVTRSAAIGLQFGKKQAERNTAESKVFGASVSTSF